MRLTGGVGKKIFWLVFSIIAAAALGLATGIFNPGEKVNALWLVVCAACVYVISYRFYSAFIATKVLVIDPKRPTPSMRLNDGSDYYPTNKWVLFGHHFAAIAGAGPLIGPMLAAQFGYLPGFLWILIGAAVAGAVHDMVVLFASVRHNGRSLAEIAKDEIGPVAGFAASIAVLFIIIVTLAGLGLAVVNALAKSPWGTFTIAFTIPIALFMGLYLHKIRIGHVAEVTVIGVTLLVAAVVLGHFIPNSPLAPLFTLDRTQVTLAIAAYALVASVLPVWMLLCPRDYLSTYMKIGTIVLLAVGIFAMAPVIEMPAVTNFIHGGGPIIPGKVFPFVFITIACGAISGFHSLISSGTTPKMISSEADIRMIGFGAMLTEGFVSIMALIAATILIPGDYFAINSMLSFDALEKMGFPVDRIGELSRLVQVDVANRPGGAVSLAVGMASIFEHIPGLKGLMPYWYNYALMFEALFILTTVDTGTRVARFIIQELIGKVYKPIIKPHWLPGIAITSIIIVASWTYLILTGSISTVWPMFGIANQLLAGIALGVGTTMIIKSGKARYSWVTFVPMVFMFVTTFTAGFESIAIFYGKTLINPSEALYLKINIAALVSIMTLAAIILLDMLRKCYSLLSNSPQKTSCHFTKTTGSVPSPPMKPGTMPSTGT